MAKGLSVGQAQAVAMDFAESMNFRVPLDFKIRDTWKEIYGFDSTYGGAYHSAPSEGARGFVTIAAGNHQAADALQRTLQHEILGHFLINTYTPAEKQDAITKIMEADHRNEPSLAGHWDKAKALYPDKPRSVQAEEVFAMIAERTQINHDHHFKMSDQILGKTQITLQDIENTIQHRVDLLKSGELEQKTFPDTDVHSRMNTDGGFERRVSEWMGSQSSPRQEISNKPRLGV